MSFRNSSRGADVAVNYLLRVAMSLVPRQAPQSAWAIVGFSLPERSERANVSAFFGLAADPSLSSLEKIYGRSR